METQSNPLKPLPVSVGKQQFDKMYDGQFPVGFARKQINEIIYDNRKKLKGYELLTKAQIIATHIVLKSELKEFVETNGLPHGYYLPENY